MRAFGTDRVAVDGERLLLSTRRPKGWKPRVLKTLTSAEFPGTAVLWEDEYYEVIEVTAVGDSGAVRYCLMRWGDHHAIRVADRYDEESERQRLEEHQAAIRQQRNRKSAILFGVLLGNLPAIVQLHLASSLGISAVRMTILSAIPSLIAFIAVGQSAVGAILEHTASSIPLWVFLVVIAWFLESAIRAVVAWTQARPMGAFIGICAYIAYYYVFAKNRTRLISPFAAPMGSSLFKSEPPPDVALRDDLQTRAAFFTLLSADEQRRLAQRYGYDYRESAKVIAFIILLGAVCGVVSSFMTLSQRGSVSAFLSLVVAGYFALEQLMRLMSFGRGPSGSVLAFLVRPLARKFLG